MEGDGRLLPIASYSFICSEHFKLTDYIVPPGKNSRCHLKDDAVQTIFRGHPLHLQSKQKSFTCTGVKRKLPSPPISPSKIMRIHSYVKSPCDIKNGDFEVRMEMETIEDKKMLSKNILLKKKIKVLHQKLRRRNIRIQIITAQKSGNIILTY